jgi:outer membrane immunogenic protein
MAVRTLGMIAAIGVMAASAAQAADPPGGDIVDQIIQTMPSQPGTAAPPAASAITTPAATPAPVAAPTAATIPPTPVVAAPRTTPVSTAPIPVVSTPVAVTSPPPATYTATPAPTITAPTPLATPAATPAAPVAASTPPPPPRPSFTPTTTMDSGDVVSQAQQNQVPQMPAPPPTLATNPVPWGGFYGGINLGGAWAGGGSGTTCFNSATGNNTGCDIIGDGKLNTSGIIGGGGVGYQMPVTLWTGSPLIVGIEGDMQGTGVSGSQHEPGPFNLVGFPASTTCSPCTFTASQQINWLGTLRARIGVPVDKFLIYGTAGLAFGEVEASQNLSFVGTSEGDVASKKSTLSGPTAGGGVEMLLDGPWSVKFEALYYDLGSLKTIGLPVNGAPTNFNDFKTFGFEGAVVRLGVTYHFGELGAM